MVNWWGVSRPWKPVVKFWFLTQNAEDVLLFSHQISSLKYNLTETHEQNSAIHNIVLSSQSISWDTIVYFLFMMEVPALGTSEDWPAARWGRGLGERSPENFEN